jgi:hypothetical protein
MTKALDKKNWDDFIKKELKKIEPLVDGLGFNFLENQAHIKGERHLMSGKKLVLIGKSKKTNQKVIIKIAKDKKAIKEIEKEHKTKNLLNKLKFAYYFFNSPKEILLARRDGYAILINQFIEEENPFFSYSQEEQFFISLKALEAQEGAHATAKSHLNQIKKIFGTYSTEDYLNSFKKFKENSLKLNNENLSDNFKTAFLFLQNNQETIKEYSGFLTHSDFVIHNIRIKNNEIYLLDQTSLHFGNKYESWARFMNYMILYNKKLEENLNYYVLHNKAKTEHNSLKLMRVYKLGELINYYLNTLDKISGNLLLLNKKRIEFWNKILENILLEKEIKKDIIDEYITSRDKLREKEEIIRQKELNQL